MRDTIRVQRVVHRSLAWWWGRRLPVWYHPSYRLPLPAFEASSGAELRRADLVAWYLVDSGLLRAEELRDPGRISYRDLARVHSRRLLESLSDAVTLSRVFAVRPDEIAVDQLMASLRAACAGTLAAARVALRERGPAINLLGGFHHAEPDRAGAFCALNDIAVAIATLRSEGFTGKIVVLDLDAHPPDGTSACFQDDPSVWIGSISGTAWTPLFGVDETVLAEGSGDVVYEAALEALLTRMPRPALAFVLAGGDVLAGDPLGKLSLTLEGVAIRDAMVARALDGKPSVWLPGGGYQRSSWRVLASTALAVARSPFDAPPADFDPLNAKFSAIAAARREEEDTSFEIDLDDVAEELRLSSSRRRRLLGFYTAEAIELALDQYGILEPLTRLGYTAFHVRLDAGNPGDRVTLVASYQGVEHVLIEASLERRKVNARDILYVHWLTLRDPRSPFAAKRPKLPGQEVPGLGMAREAGELLQQMARRLGLSGVVFTPAYFHTAYAARHQARFVSPERQGRFEAMLRDLASMKLADASRAVAAGRVACNGEPYAWEAADMVSWVVPVEDDPIAEAKIAAERERCKFTAAATMS